MNDPLGSTIVTVDVFLVGFRAREDVAGGHHNDVGPVPQIQADRALTNPIAHFHLLIGRSNGAAKRKRQVTFDAEKRGVRIGTQNVESGTRGRIRDALVYHILVVIGVVVTVVGMIPTLVLHNKAMHLGQFALDKAFTDGPCDKADNWVAAIFVLLQIDDEIRSWLALTSNATIANIVILEELDLDTITLPQHDAHTVDFAVDHILHKVGSMSVNGGENLCSVPLVIFDLVKADGVDVEIGASEDEVSRHK